MFSEKIPIMIRPENLLPASWGARSIWVFPKIEGIPKWMVKMMENPI